VCTHTAPAGDKYATVELLVRPALEPGGLDRVAGEVPELWGV
jgi:hypothetical protein